MDGSNFLNEIELLGLTEGKISELPELEGKELKMLGRSLVGELFVYLEMSLFQGVLESLAHGLITVLNKEGKKAADAWDKEKNKIRGLINGVENEITDQELEEATQRAQHLEAVQNGLEKIVEGAKLEFLQQTGGHYMPPSAPLKFGKQQGANFFEAKELLSKHEKEQSERFDVLNNCLGLVVGGDRLFLDAQKVVNVLNGTKERFQNRYGKGMVILTKGDLKGPEKIASDWASQNGVAVVAYKPNWAGDGKAAGYKAMDQMLDSKVEIQGVALFGVSRSSEVLKTKAENKSKRVLQVN